MAMKKKIECEIMAHENGWAVLVGNVMEAVYPSRYLAVTSAKTRHMDFILVDEAMPLRHSTTDVMATDRAVSRRNGEAFRLTVAAPYQVDITLKRRRGEINTPVSIEGRDLVTGKF
ncbi:MULTISPECIES: hypothetical protein [Agrobacterium]|uniref:hypothetical protein n=1 Tax=Agrobacterium TaxID=357 RepID=UPI001574A7F2|nr:MULTISPECIES: hypothetical protein [Agrobacterium]MCW8280758.1 hypothetical protein [Agrobacterium sp. InxBP2]NTE44743.1 hypothetical protein [Agrobacterium pusense]